VDAADPRETGREQQLVSVLRVGAQRQLERPSAAAQIARDGDTIEIDAGTYPGDAAVWRANRLTIRGVGGRAHLRADGAEAEGKGIWVIKGNDTTIESVEFSGAKVPDKNGAGIRQEGSGLTVRNCHFHDNGTASSPGPTRRRHRYPNSGSRGTDSETATATKSTSAESILHAALQLRTS
jgi:hypothetical protein